MTCSFRSGRMHCPSKGGVCQRDIGSNRAKQPRCSVRWWASGGRWPGVEATGHAIRRGCFSPAQQAGVSGGGHRRLRGRVPSDRAIAQQPARPHRHGFRGDHAPLAQPSEHGGRHLRARHPHAGGDGRTATRSAFVLAANRPRSMKMLLNFDRGVS